MKSERSLRHACLTPVAIALLSLTPAHSSVAETIYRCGNAYSTQPCAGARRIEVLPQTEEQKESAEQSRQRWRELREDLDARERSSARLETPGGVTGIGGSTSPSRGYSSGNFGSIGSVDGHLSTAPSYPGPSYTPPWIVPHHHPPHWHRRPEFPQMPDQPRPYTGPGVGPLNPPRTPMMYPSPPRPRLTGPRGIPPFSPR